MRIGFFVWEYPPIMVGGLGTYAENITSEFVSLGNEVTVFSPNPGNLKTREIINDVEVHRPLIVDASNVFPMFAVEELKKWGTNIRLFNDIFIYNTLSAAKFINVLIKKEAKNFDIVCVHDWLSSISGLVIKNEIDIPVVFHVHSTEWGRSRGQGSTIVSNIERVMSETADRIITVSHAMREDLTRRGWPKSKIRVVWNGVNTELYNSKNYNEDMVEGIREKYCVEKDWNMLLFIGRLTWVKGVTNLVQSMPMVLKKYPKTKLVILGQGEEQRNIDEITTRLRIKDNVICRFEFVPENERILHYAAADTCIFPSVYEPFGIVSLEAMAMAKPLIVGAQGVTGFREQVIPSGSEKTGIHVNGGNPADIAWGIKETLKDIQKAKKWGENGRKRVLENFTWRIAAEQTLDIYNKLLSRDDSSSP